jgi:hypothetical protein
MIGLLPEMEQIGKPVLSSPRSGIERVRALLQERASSTSASAA